MLTDPPPVKFRKRHAKANATPATPVPPPAALVLVNAGYSVPHQWLLLSFDRAIDIAGVDAAQFVVNDPGADLLVQGFAASLNDPVSVLIEMSEIGSSTGPGTTLTAGAANGIVAVNDGGTWAGVTDLELPWP